jgi:hypothetical protein
VGYTPKHAKPASLLESELEIRELVVARAA